MLTAYLDESGSHAKHHVVVAGFVGKKRPWVKFAPAWEEGLGKRPWLHVSSMKFEYDSERKWLEKLGPIPYEHKLRAIFGAVNVEDYADLTEGTVAEIHARGVTVALVKLLDVFLLDEFGDERFEVKYESSPMDFYIDKALKLVSEFPGFIREDGKHRIAGWGPIPKGDSILFQPADYLANHLYNKAIDPESIRTKWTAPITEGHKVYGSTIPKERVRRFFDHLRSDFFRKGIPKEQLKAYRASVRRGERDPWEGV